MEKEQAQRLIKKTFENEFNEESFTEFISNLLNKVDWGRGRDWSQGDYIFDDYREHIRRYKRIGLYTTQNREEVEILIIETQSLAKLDRARSALRNFVVKRLKKKNRNYALAAFYSKEDKGADWRFSFIKIEHEDYTDEKGKVKDRVDISPAKRYSYLVGNKENSYTAQKQLLPLIKMEYANPNIKEIEEAFGIETVTDEFFQQYRWVYETLLNHLDKDHAVKKVIHTSGLDLARFSKKLLGQIVFLYFLQKKGWLGVPKDQKWGQGKKDFLRDLFKKGQTEQKEFYQHYLQYLFYEALAKERDGEKDPAYYLLFDCKIPFLNGGLFEADYDWQNNPISIPDHLFSNNKRNKSGDIGTGILDVFDRYNFTIKEDEPLEKEVAVDPEMLGKVFENMLDDDERKSKGAFYTPREIVHYMCQESLLHYLDKTINKEREICPKIDMDILIHKGSLMLEHDKRVLREKRETKDYPYLLPKSIRDNAKIIDEKLADIKICDPAIGSGAFPVGLLNEIVNARLVLEPFIKGVQDMGPDSSLSYHFKRHAIQENIYGVDIDASAIDIARLRLWLSLIVDEEDYENIEALPNLDYKIIQGNSLIGIAKHLFNESQLKELEEKKKQFFDTTHAEEKKSLRQNIDQLFAQITNNKKDFDFEIYFSEVWHKQGGFDIVIGNPPYVQIQKFSGTQEQKDWEQQNYETFTKSGDLYCLFYEKGRRILRDSGVLTFITSNKWMRANYGEKTRAYFLDHVGILQLIDFGDSPFFEGATTYTNILMFSKNKTGIPPKVWDLSKINSTNKAIEALLAEKKSDTDVFNSEAFLILAKEQALIKRRIEEIGTPLKEWDIEINYGIKTGFNEAFIIDEDKMKALIAKDPKSKEIIKPILRGRDIKRYTAVHANLWLIDSHNGYQNTPPINIDEYPAVKEYLNQNWDNLKNRQDKGVTPYNLRHCAYHPEIEKDKIVYAEIVYDAAFYYDTKKFYPEATAFIITGENLKYLTAMLNSNFLTYAFKHFYSGGDLRGNTFRYKKVFIEKLPIPKIPKESQQVFETLVDYIILATEKKYKYQAEYFDAILDGLVFEIYFAPEFQTAKIEIFKHIGNLPPISQFIEDDEKLAVIQKEFDRLYDINHRVRNNVLFYNGLDLVRIVKGTQK